MSQDAMSVHGSNGPGLGPSRRLAHLVSKFEILDAMSSVESELRALPPGPTATTARATKTRRAVVSPCSTTPSALSRSSTARRSRMPAPDGHGGGALSPPVSESMSLAGARPRSMVAERRKLFESDAANMATNSIVMNRRSQFERCSNGSAMLPLATSWHSGHSWTPSPPPPRVLREDSSSLNKANNYLSNAHSSNAHSSGLAAARTCPSLVSRFSSPDGDRVPISPSMAIIDRVPLCSPGYQARRACRRDSIGTAPQASPCQEKPLSMCMTPAKLQTQVARSKTPLSVSTGNLTYCTAPSTDTVRIVGQGGGCGVDAANTKAGSDGTTRLRKSTTHTHVGPLRCSPRAATDAVRESRYSRPDVKINAQRSEPRIVEIELPISSTCFVAQAQRGTIYSLGEQAGFDHDDAHGDAHANNAALARDHGHAALHQRIGLYESLSRTHDLHQPVPSISPEPMSRQESAQEHHMHDFEPPRKKSGFESKLRQLSGSWSKSRLARAMARQPADKTADDAARTKTSMTTATTTTTSRRRRRRRFTPAFTSEASSSSVYDQDSVTRLVGRREKRKSLSVGVYEACSRPKSPARVLPWHKTGRRTHACYASVDDGADDVDDDGVDGGEEMRRGRRRVVSRSSGTLVAQVHCSLDQPQPVRAKEMNRLVSLCLEKVKATGRKGRGQSE